VIVNLAVIVSALGNGSDIVRAISRGGSSNERDVGAARPREIVPVHGFIPNHERGQVPG
jgi:hypothetical protein